MRDILFRGKTISANEWVYGGYFSMNSRTFIVVENNDDYRMYEVDPNSIGQTIDQEDCNDDWICEGDIVNVDGEGIAEIKWEDTLAMFILEFDTWFATFDDLDGCECEIIGNAIDDPDLLKRKGQEW